jgi:hypothetical protein
MPGPTGVAYGEPDDAGVQGDLHDEVVPAANSSTSLAETYKRLGHVAMAWNRWHRTRISRRIFLASDALGRVRRPPHLRFCRLLLALVSPLFLPLLPLLPILLPLILALNSCILILLLLPITPMH